MTRTNTRLWPPRRPQCRRDARVPYLVPLMTSHVHAALYCKGSARRNVFGKGRSFYATAFQLR